MKFAHIALIAALTNAIELNAIADEFVEVNVLRPEPTVEGEDASDLEDRIGDLSLKIDDLNDLSADV